MKRDSTSRKVGFTVVELVVVIAVIGILASVIVLAYHGWQTTTAENVMKSDLNGAAAAMEDARNWGRTYPVPIPSTFKASAGIILAGGGSSDGKSFCISATSTEAPGESYYITNATTTAQSGTCTVAPGVSVITLAGNGQNGIADGTGDQASFGKPAGLVVDSAGNIYVADDYNSRVRMVTPGGVTSTIAGSGGWGGGSGFANGTGTAALFAFPDGIAIDGSGNLIVADTGNNMIRKITPAGVVTTFAGSTTAGSTNATGTSARFDGPESLVIDSSGNIFVADTGNNRIRKITPAGVVTTFAGSSQGYQDATGTSAQFDQPYGIAIDSANNLYVSDTDNEVIRKITPAGVVTTLAGNGTWGYADGPGTSAEFGQPHGLAVDSAGNVYVADYNNNMIRKITPSGVVSAYAGTGQGGDLDGPALAAQLYEPLGVAVDSAGTVYFSGNDNYIREIK